MKLLILDNYDSFTWNLEHMVRDITGERPDVIRNDQVSVEQVDVYDAIMLSPGPGVPEDAGIMKQVISTYHARLPIFGVCLGMQAIGETFGGQLENLSTVFHGIHSTIIKTDPDELIFSQLDKEFVVGRYHSWVVSNQNVPDVLKITAVDQDGMIMALRHRDFNVCGVQFHPESVLTPEGKTILSNWLQSAGFSIK